MKTELIKVLVLCTTLLSACATVKSKKTSHEQALQVRHDSQENISQQSWEKDNTLLLDTSNNEYVVQITPLGKFVYSTEKGFEGMAEKVVLKGKANNRRMVHKQQQNGNQLYVQKSKAGSTAFKAKVQQVEKSRKPRLATISAGVLILLGLVYWIWRKWRLI